MTAELFVILFAFFVQFTDKAGSEHVCLSELAKEKRVERGIAIDSLDYAVSPIYMDSLDALSVRVYHTSRWMNGATIEADSSTIQTIAKWAFVDSIYLTRITSAKEMLNHDSSARDWVSLQKREVSDKDIADNINNYSAAQQNEQLDLHLLHEAGFRGQGITMAIIDGGFQNVDSMAAFDPIREQILGVYDMTDDADDIYGNTGGHGTKCFSTIAGITSDYTGAATAAEYYLIRSEEHLTESPKEMDNWVAAIELADSLGIDIASTSLGYAIFDTEEFTLSYADIDGQSTRCSHAAQIASRKGMLLVVAAGNEGNKDWHYISAPADADSILTVGAVDIHDSIAAFSSWGPTADGRVKPEVCAVGYQTALIDPIDNRVVRGNGTSFACPIIAGMAACLWSALPTASNIEIRERIIRSGDRYDSPHDQYGYGIPNTWQAYTQSTGLMTPGKGEQKAQKVIINGQLWIIHEGEVYNIIGVKSARNEKKRSNCFHN